MATVELKGVAKRYGALKVIDDIDLDLEDGSLTVFVGPSGCGKSTLLRMIAGLEPITSGDILIDGQRINDATPTERGVAMVFQNYALYPHMTVRNNIGFPLRMAGMKSADIGRRVEQAANRLHITPLLERKPAALSGGQRQRVAIGRAIVRDPNVFLFDEPLSNLDAELRVKMRLEIAELHRSLASTMIYVTHDQVEAMTLADRIVVLRAGNVEQIGTPISLYDDPDNMFVAGFIGSPRMNFLAGHVVSRSTSGVRVKLSEFENVEFELALGSDLAPGAKISIGMRPENFSSDGSAQFDLRVDMVESLGGVSYGYSNMRGEDALTVDLKGDRSVRAGDTIHTGFHPSKALLFDPASGARLR
ncbi:MULTISPECIES: sn-glycerol-3-phosphate ABC transporter ATP-binding protein UgpC [Rhizobium/Agrobacterium group]|uniref:sn-glycerol-3-phosphate ABC transporter ATP-binding protein UgpC n=1 Tax=Rhizobium/Agrobacterium group TaxID=227290 RepID=UPI0012E74E9A|nr:MULTISPECIES: sn-glycerol-3-phosphate ABC transporter ATP-binding protein UgpC [Rhizobium/Agrobacterium group]MCF1472355.1 sn-glycerol-3-phosphate ABC transporter ATP-binding protein UgpC [Allorhizobium ampelinum]MVA49555.1 sn-glycerol-3-phosphate ABC transporter ATP-binding protein UgpC [Agrobacterium vitis]NSZ54462.1 sn-glycerol-3-phosphate ABC transporter ATP-binding protein UgpC [Agrobacterium vitis]NTA33454.1 sn-glycerol-3-phosphate ABC transporter ATP-binding protein UgpC [Agrobacteriu